MTDQHNTPDEPDEATDTESKVEHPLRSGAVPGIAEDDDVTPGLERLKLAYRRRGT